MFPINMASLFFLAEPMGGWIAFLAIGAMMLNAPIVIAERGFSKLMAFPHLIPWTVLVLILIFASPSGTEAYRVFLMILLAVDVISLAFDYPDALNWWRGDRVVAGAQKPAPDPQT